MEFSKTVKHAESSEPSSWSILIQAENSLLQEVVLRMNEESSALSCSLSSILADFQEAASHEMHQLQETPSYAPEEMELSDYSELFTINQELKFNQI